MVLSNGLLMRSPLDDQTSAAQRAEVKFHRQQPQQQVEADDDRQRFRLPRERDFQRQFYHVYAKRLEKMRQRIQDAGVDVTRLADLEKGASDVVIAGTVFKNQKLKPNILNELDNDVEDADGLALFKQPKRPKFVSDDDDLILEDDLQRIKLIANDVLKVEDFVTGVVCGFRGYEKDSGKFHVVQVVFPSVIAPQIPRPMPEKDVSVIFISGWDASLASQMAVDWICGEDGEMADQEVNASVERVILAGNCVNDDVDGADDLLRQLAGSVRTEIMPGENDPANLVLPQQPLHPCLCPKAASFSSNTFKTVTNPYSTEICGGIRTLGTSGQNVDDVIRNSGIDDSAEVMEALLKWSHLAPTCPDTLGCFPYRDEDPFILEKRPHLFFAGNQKHFQQKTFEGVKLISVPKFSESRSIVVVNMKTLDAHQVLFDCKF